MERLLARHRCDPTGVILRLAWFAGLTREEIGGLMWEQVGFEDKLLHLPDRTVPLEPELAVCLHEWQVLYGECGPYVVISEKFRKPLAPESISRLARFALSAEGQDKVRLLDLRYDFVLRKLEAYDWPYVLRISGLSVTTYRNCLAHLVAGKTPAQPTPRDTDSEEFQLWQILQAEKTSPAGIALWLSTQIGLQAGEIVALTWERVDFGANRLRLEGRDVPMTLAVSRILLEERQRRAPEDDPHVVLSPRTRKPLTVARLSTMTRTILIRGGMEDQSLRYLRRDDAQENERNRLLQYARERGSISRGEAMELLGLTGGVAYNRLNTLAFDGELVRINSRYYPVGSVIAPEQQAAAIRSYIAEAGSAYCQDIARMLHIGKRTTARILKRMVDRGELVLLRREKRYQLPKDSA